MLNYIRTDGTEGIRAYTNGIREGKYAPVTVIYQSGFRSSQGDGKIILGRAGLNNNGYVYTSVQMNELLMFNQFLSEAEIRKLSQ